MARLQACELSIDEALGEAPATADQLMTMAAARKMPLRPAIQRVWVPSAGTWCYHTVIAVTVAEPLLDQVAAIFYDGASMPAQPWYAGFIRGQVKPLPNPAAEFPCQLAMAGFDVGLRSPRAYRQLVSRHANHSMQAIVLRSVEAAVLPWPDTVVPAFTLQPSGDVFEYRDGQLLWHHICTTPGAGVLPMPWDRWLINALRGLRVDQAERETYKEEALSWARWAAQGFSC